MNEIKESRGQNSARVLKLSWHIVRRPSEIRSMPVFCLIFLHSGHQGSGHRSIPFLVVHIVVYQLYRLHTPLTPRYTTLAPSHQTRKKRKKKRARNPKPQCDTSRAIRPDWKCSWIKNETRKSLGFWSILPGLISSSLFLFLSLVYLHNARWDSIFFLYINITYFFSVTHTFPHGFIADLYILEFARMRFLINAVWDKGIDTRKKKPFYHH